jgi:hypothetical protein
VEEELPECIANPQMQKMMSGHKEMEAEEELPECTADPQM